MTRYLLAVPLLLLLGGANSCSTANVETATQTLTGACNTAASALNVATALYKAGKLAETKARIVDNSAAVIDGFCHPGATVPTDLTSAVQAVSVAGANIVALNLSK